MMLLFLLLHSIGAPGLDRGLNDQAATQPYIQVLGIAQDAGYPQAGCNRACCELAWRQPQRRRFATSLAIVDPLSSQRWLVECTPDFRQQLRLLDQSMPREFAHQNHPVLDGILLTHAHIGHYAGLMHLGREAIGANEIPVFAMPRMAEFLKTNGPWDQLIKLKNIQIKPIHAEKTFQLNPRIRVTPITVPHRDEYSETVAFVIEGPLKSALFLPDIDKWERWEQSIDELLKRVDVAWLDGTFHDSDELPGRDMSQIPHPFITESISRFSSLPESTRDKIRFIHFNHTNPVLQPDATATHQLRRSGMHLAEQSEKYLF